MSRLEKDLISSKVIFQFTLPRLHRGKQWYVDFFAYDPARDKMRRKKYMLDHYKNERDRENVASILIHNLFEKLKVGWNPFVNAKKTRQFTEFSVVLQRYHDFKDNDAVYKNEIEANREERKSKERMLTATINAAKDVAIAYFKREKNYLFFW